MVVHRVDAFESQRGGQRGGDQRVLAALAASDFPALQQRDQTGVEAVAGTPFGLRQAQPLHQRGYRFAAREEQGTGWRSRRVRRGLGTGLV